MQYIPSPIYTADVEIPEELLPLSELLAENTHEVWAAGRAAEGWTYGETRDDRLKKTPCMLPYGKLPESEKEYDRSTALETIRLILKLGYRISKD